MDALTIRPAEKSEYDEIARVWMQSWVSVGLEGASEAMREREGFVFEKEAPHPHGLMMRHYRWKKGTAG
jgi:hypothetical protein